MRKTNPNKTECLGISRKKVLGYALILLFWGIIIFLIGQSLPPELGQTIIGIYGVIVIVLGIFCLIAIPLIPKCDEDNEKNKTKTNQ